MLSPLSDLHTRIHKAATLVLAGILVARLLAFALGMVHAQMPGHGETVVFSYFLGVQVRIGAGVAMAAQDAAFPVVAAFMVVALGIFLAIRPRELAGDRGSH